MHPMRLLILKIALGFAAFILVNLSLLIYIQHHIHEEVTESVVTPVHVPTFQRGDCFNYDEEKESWEIPTPDGIIERVGNSHYLIMFREAAEKRGGDKKGSTMSIPTFDSFHHKVECPKEWVQHTHRNN